MSPADPRRFGESSGVAPLSLELEGVAAPTSINYTGSGTKCEMNALTNSHNY